MARTGLPSTMNLERQGNQFVVAGRHVGQCERFENVDIVAAQRVVRVERLAVHVIDRRGIGAEETQPSCAKQRCRLRCEIGELLVPAFSGAVRGACLDEEPLDRCAGSRPARCAGVMAPRVSISTTVARPM